MKINWGQCQYQLFRLSHSVLIQINSRKTHNKSEPKPKPNHIQDGFPRFPREPRIGVDPVFYFIFLILSSE